MANKKISEFADASALTGAEISEIVQAGVNVKISEATKKVYYSGYKGTWNTTDTLPPSSNITGDYWRVPAGGWDYLSSTTGTVYPPNTKIEAMIDGATVFADFKIY